MATKKSRAAPGETATHLELPPRARILKSAHELFYGQGIRGVGVEAVAAAADTNKMTLYRHFSSKDELVAAYLRDVAAEIEGSWERIGQRYPDDPRGHILAWLREMGRQMARPESRGCPITNAAIERREIGVESNRNAGLFFVGKAHIDIRCINDIRTSRA